MDSIVPLTPSGRSQPRAETELQAELAEAGSPSLVDDIASSVISAARDGFLLLDGQGTLLDANSTAERMLGEPATKLFGRHLLDLLQIPNAPFQKDGAFRSVDYMLLGVVTRENGQSLPLEVAILTLGHAAKTLFAAQLRDISVHSELDDELHRLAYFDPVTQLPNRYATLMHLKELLAEGESFTVWHLNLDRFRVLKNSLGHGFGDRVLIAIGERLGSSLDHGSWVSRLGNDEFVIILPHLPSLRFDEICQVIQAALTRGFTVDGREIHLKGSLGVVESSSAYGDPAQMLSDAEIASFQAKIAGGGTFTIFDQPMRQVLMDLQRTESDLRLAVENGDQMWVAYQPIVDLRTGTLAGFEALVRWEHPMLGQIPPNDFIPIAEATGLIVPLGTEVLTQACRSAQRWTAMVGNGKLPFISVNLSLRQLTEGDFIELARDLLHSTGIDPAKLKLEITESMLMTDPEESISKLREIRKLGVELSIDDFGTGYSSLAYLHQLPVKTLKIDKSFVSRIRDPNDREIVRIITELAGILGLNVIAEGVETLEDVEALQSIGCGYGQGFFFGKPLDPEDAERLIVDPKRWPIA